MTAPVNGGSPELDSSAPADQASIVVALDLFGGDGGPEVVADAALLVLNEQTGVDLVLVGPPEVAADLLAARGAVGRIGVEPAATAVGMHEDAVAAVRSRPDCSVRVGAALVRDGRARATVSIGHTGAALAAATLTLPRLPGVNRAAVALVVPGLAGDVVLLDAGGTPDASPELLSQFALMGEAFARALGIADEPRVGLLTIGTEPGKGDQLRRDAHTRLSELPIDYVGGVEGSDVALGGRVDVVVTDGFTGNIVLKTLEGAAHNASERIAAVYDDPAPARRVATDLIVGTHAGAVLLGVDGVSVVGHGASTAREIAAYVSLAVRSVREQLVPRTAARLADLAVVRGAAQ